MKRAVIVIGALLLICAIALSGFAGYTYYTDIQPRIANAGVTVNGIVNAAPISNKVSFVYDTNDNLLLKLKGTNKGSYTSNIPDSFLNTVLATKKLSGGDSLSMLDCVKVFCTPARFISGLPESLLSRQSLGMQIARRKTDLDLLDQCILAARLDQSMSEKELLLYLINQVNFGPDVLGIGEASYTYFNCEPEDLSDIQWQFLSYICNSKDIVDSKMLELFEKWYTSSGKTLSTAESAELASATSSDASLGLRGFIKTEIYEKLETSKGYTTTQVDRLLDSEQLTIKTSISLPLQGAIQSNINTSLGSYSEITSSNEYEVQGIVAVTDNTSGLLKALVSGRNSTNKSASLNLRNNLPAKDIYRNFYTLFPLYSNTSYSPKKLVDVSEKANVVEPAAIENLTDSQFPVLDEVLPDGVQESMLQTLNSSGAASTSIIRLSAAYSMLTRDGEYIKPSCIVEIRCGDEVLYTVESEEYSQIYNARASRVLISDLCNGEKYYEGFDTNVDNSLWGVYLTPSYTVTAWAGKPFEACNADKVKLESLQTLLKSVVKSTETEMKPDPTLTFKTYKALEKEEENIKKTNFSLFEKYIKEERSSLASAQINTVESAATFNTVFNKATEKLNTFKPYLDPTMWSSLRTELDNYKRSRIDKLLVYSTALG